jgi:hypothetical protein
MRSLSVPVKLESYGYLAHDAEVTSVLRAEGYSFGAANEPASSQFFITSAETKAFGHVNPTSTSLDGYVGFSGACSALSCRRIRKTRRTPPRRSTGPDRA